MNNKIASFKKEGLDKLRFSFGKNVYWVNFIYRNELWGPINFTADMLKKISFVDISESDRIALRILEKLQCNK